MSFTLPSLPSLPGIGSLGGQRIGTPELPTIPTVPSLDGASRGAGSAGGGVTVQVVMDGATILAADDAEHYITDMTDRAVRRGVQLGVA